MYYQAGRLVDDEQIIVLEYSGNIRANAWSNLRPENSAGIVAICFSALMTGP